jgi:hypothetical protein
MKVVINKCFGGFGLSPFAVKRLAELKGRPCYFFRRSTASLLHGDYLPTTPEAIRDELMFWAFDIPNPNEVFMREDNWHDMTMEQRRASSALYEKHTHNTGRELDRADPDLVRVVEELGSETASGRFAKLVVVEIPDGVEYEIDEYDGREHIAETHRTWA